MAQRHTLFWLSSTYIAVSRLWLDEQLTKARQRLEGGEAAPEADATQLALARTFSFVHRLLWLFSISYLFTGEFSRLYCDNETIAAHYLRKFAQFLTRHEKYSLAAKVLSIAVKWNVLWLGRKSPAIASSYRQAAVANVLAGRNWWSLVKKITNVQK